MLDVFFLKSVKSSSKETCGSFEFVPDNMVQREPIELVL